MKNLSIKILFKNLIFILGFTATVASFFLTISNPFLNSSQNEKLIIYIGFLAINFFIALKLSWPKTKLTIKVNNKVKINIFYGDLFQQKDNIVIPVNEYFDTIVNESIISSRTIHGQFVRNIFGGNEKELDGKIKKELKDKQIISVNNHRPIGRIEKYQLGTVISVPKNNQSFFLVAVSRFNEFNKAECFNLEYQNVIHSLLDYLHINSQGKEVSIPLIGSGQSGINMNKQKLLEYLIFSIQFHDNLTLSGNLNIILHKSLKNDINLNNVDYLVT